MNSIWETKTGNVKEPYTSISLLHAEHCQMTDGQIELYGD